MKISKKTYIFPRKYKITKYRLMFQKSKTHTIIYLTKEKGKRWPNSNSS